MEGIRHALRQMLGPKVGIGVTDPRGAPDGLWPQEAAAIARAVPKRRAEFAAGRRAARDAMMALTVPAAAIAQGSDRAPIWPQGLCGSIAHCDTCCIAVVARIPDYSALGIDIEPATPLPSELIDIICTKPEQNWLITQSIPGLAAKMIFSAKEAVYKAQYPLTGAVIGFDAVTVGMTNSGFTTVASATLPALKGAILIQDGLILSTAYV